MEGYLWTGTVFVLGFESGFAYTYGKVLYVFLGFESGLADTYGEVPTKQDVGTVPDGEHGQLFEYIFCCRNDGEVEDPIKLPFKSSFILYLGEDYYSGCQDVEGSYLG